MPKGVHSSEVGSDSALNNAYASDNTDQTQVQATYGYRARGGGTRRALLRRRDYGRIQASETGSEAQYRDSDDSEFTGSQYSEHTGHKVSTGTVNQPFYQVNDARYNGADLEPVPITPVIGQNWPEMQIQLRNGWGTTSFGKKLTYDNYLRLLTDSASKNRNYLIPNPAGLGPSAGRPGPAPANFQNLVDQAGQVPRNPGGPGHIADHVLLTGRRYYG